MASDDFDKVMEFVLEAEGGYANNPADPGGETNFGISKRSYPTVDIKHLTVDGAKAIYERDYWDAINGPSLPWPVSLVMMDCAVNEGVGKAKDVLATCLDAQGYTDVAQQKDPEWLAVDMIFERLRHYLSLSTFKTFGKGWTTRMADLYDAARA